MAGKKAKIGIGSLLIIGGILWLLFQGKKGVVTVEEWGLSHINRWAIGKKYGFELIPYEGTITWLNPWTADVMSPTLHYQYTGNFRGEVDWINQEIAKSRALGVI